jgi:hypothetical protein
LAAATVCGLALLAAGSGQILPSAKAQDPVSPATFAAPAEQPPAKLIVDSPVPDLLAKGVVVIQYRTENLRILPVFGPAAATVSPRIGHLHVTVDDTPWLWAHMSNDPLFIYGLPPGPHKILIELVNANHKTLAQGVVQFEVPKRLLARADSKAPANYSARNAANQDAKQPPAKIILDPPQPDLLAKGVAFIRYRTENVQIVPVFGPAALAISPRVGPLHVTVDDSPWRWGDTSGNPVDVGGLPPGPHKILIELVDANHQILARDVVKFEVPRPWLGHPPPGLPRT